MADFPAHSHKLARIDTAQAAFSTALGRVNDLVSAQNVKAIADKVDTLIDRMRAREIIQA